MNNEVQQLFDSLVLEGEASRGDMETKIQKLKAQITAKRETQADMARKALLKNLERDHLLERIANVLGIARSDYPNFFQNE